MLEALFPLFYENLQDNIPSVRQGAAIAISNVCMAYGKQNSIRKIKGVFPNDFFYPLEFDREPSENL